MIDGLKPYSAMKDSGMPWIGQLPVHWDAAALRRYCKVFAGATPSRAVPEYWHGGSIPWLASGDVNQRRIRAARQFITQAGFAASSTKWIRPGSLVLALAGQGRTKGMVATVECRTTCNQSLAAIEPAPQTSDHRYLGYYLESRYAELRALVGDGLRDGLNLEHIRAVPTPVPPLLEQAAVVRFLNHADRRIQRCIRAKQKLIKLLEEQKQAIIHRAVTRGLDPNVHLKPSGVEWLGDLPEHWDAVPMRRLVEVRDGTHDTPAYVDATESSFPLVTSKDFGATSICFDNAKHISSKDHVEIIRRSNTQQGDVLMSMIGGNIGKAVIVDTGREFSIKNVALFKTSHSECLSRFLLYYLQSGLLDVQISLLSKGGAQNFLSLGEIRNLVFPAMPESEMARIVDSLGLRLEPINALMKALKETLRLAGEYRTRLIADVVTGKLDVREAAARLPIESDALEETELDDALASDEGDAEAANGAAEEAADEEP